MECARLNRYGLLSVSGDDAREFLHAQLTVDVRNLPRERAALAGWCSAKGRLLATFLVIPAPQGFLLQLARDLAPAVAKRLPMFVLRAKVKIADESERWAQFGVWDADGNPNVAWDNGRGSVPVGERRFLRLEPAAAPSLAPTADEEAWTLLEIRAGRPLITAATQDQFVPQMVNLEKLGAVDFQKGCYPGQEIVARAQYRGEVKRRMVRLQAPGQAGLRPGQEYNGGVVVDSAGGELLAVMPTT
ncbi:MAG: folate-binding protein [Betaproteobacteria bacterium]|nr:MAG: folate-binding protein [Betaproteobacteria bacterium]